jgi:hypothetical protein
MFSNGEKPLTRHVLVVTMGSVAAILIIGFLVWLNYGWMLWNMPKWEQRVGTFALRTFGDAWQRESRVLSGHHATDCGRVQVRGNPETATECALKAFREGRPFRVRYDLQGIDSDVSAGLVYTPEGKLYALVFDGDPSGQGGTSWSRQRTEKLPCPVPFQVYVNPRRRLNCFSKEDVPPHDLMSPNFESY